MKETQWTTKTTHMIQLLVPVKELKKHSVICCVAARIPERGEVFSTAMRCLATEFLELVAFAGWLQIHPCLGLQKTPQTSSAHTAKGLAQVAFLLLGVLLAAPESCQ